MAKTRFQATGENSKAPFTLKVHRGDGMALLAMNWRSGMPPRNFVGFSIEFREPGSDEFWPVLNSMGFPGQRKTFSDPPIESTKAPIQKFRWVHFPGNAEKKGEFTYRVTPCFMDKPGTLSRGEPQTAAIALMRETIPGKLNVAFTRGFVSSQAFVRNFAPDAKLSTLLPDDNKKGLQFKPTHNNAAEAHAWMGFEGRSAICELLDQAIKKNAQVRAIAYDLNLPEIVTRLEKLETRLKIIIDDSTEHRATATPESKSAARLRKSAGTANVVRQHMANLQHHKSIAVRGPGIDKVLYGSTNFTLARLLRAVEQRRRRERQAGRGRLPRRVRHLLHGAGRRRLPELEVAGRLAPLGVAGLDAKVAFSPHSKTNGVLTDVGKDIGRAKSCVLFSLAFLGQTTKGPIGPALGSRSRARPSIPWASPTHA